MAAMSGFAVFANVNKRLMNKTEKRLYTVFGLTFAEQPRALLLRGSSLESSALRFWRCRKVANFLAQKGVSGSGFFGLTLAGRFCAD